MGKIVIHDTADVTITEVKTGKVVLNAEAQLAQVTGAISEEDLKGGIGNRKLYKIRTDKEVNLTMRSAVADVEYWAMTQGVTVDESGVANVTANYKGDVTDDGLGANLEIHLFDGDAVIGSKASIEVNGVQHVGIVQAPITLPTAPLAPTPLASVVIDTAHYTGATPALTPPTLTLGESAVVFFQKEVVGKQIKIDSNKFAGKYKVEYRTIAYDLDTATVTSDIYFIFPETIPAGEFDISLESGSVYTPEISFSVMNPIGNSEMGQIIEVAR